MISTYCLNPCFDQTVEVEEFRLGGANRIARSRMDPGGKGVNVARVLTMLGVETCCVLVLPEKGADEYLESLKDAQLDIRSIRTPGSVRRNTKIRSMDTGLVTELNEAGVPLSSWAASAVREQAKALRETSAMHVLSGSLPPHASPAYYYNLIQDLAPAPVFLDTSGRALLEGIKARPMFVKPNLAELQAAMGRELKELNAVRDAAEDWIAQGISYVCVSMGPDGAMLVTRDGSVHAPAVPVEGGSTVGAGDAMVAGLIYGYLKGEGPEEALRCGVAAASASCMTEGTQMARREDYEACYSRVEVRSM